MIYTLRIVMKDNTAKNIYKTGKIPDQLISTADETINRIYVMDESNSVVKMWLNENGELIEYTRKGQGN